MKSHIEQTIKDVVAEIGRLQDLVGVLRRFGDEGEIVGLLREAKTVPVAAAPREVGRTVTVKVSEGRRKPTLKAVVIEDAKAVQTLKEPFRMADVIDATGKPRAAVNSLLGRWVGRGWLTRVGPGEFTRTRAFGGGASTAPADAGNASANPVGN